MHNRTEGLSRRAALASSAAGLVWLTIPSAATARGNGENAMSATTRSFLRYEADEIEFKSAGEVLRGVFCAPHGADRVPAIVILGPFGFVKEQAPMQYATRLAQRGFAALAFDTRFSGESGGVPRRLESPEAKIADARAAIDWLASHGRVDASRIGALGICQGASEMIAVAAGDARVRTLALVSGQYLYRENLEKFFSGGGPTLDDRVERGRKALAAYKDNGVVEYGAVVDPQDKSVALPWPPINDWYQPWTSLKWGQRGNWENRYATMSDAEVWSFNVDQFAERLTVPTLLLHGEQSDGGVEAVSHVHARVGSKKKHMSIVDGVFHTRFYDDPEVVEPAAAEVADWLAAHLA